MSKTGKILIVSGPSGCGKSTVLNKVFESIPKHFFSISATTRQPRPGETDGVDYYFISKEQFLDMLNNGKLLEYTQYVGNYYGTPIDPIYDHAKDGYIVILDVDVKGFEQITAKIPEAISVFFAPPSMEELESRLRGRGTETEETVNKRMAQAAYEMAFADRYDHVIINDTVERAADELLTIINA